MLKFILFWIKYIDSDLYDINLDSLRINFDFLSLCNIFAYQETT